MFKLNKATFEKANSPAIHGIFQELIVSLVEMDYGKFVDRLSGLDAETRFLVSISMGKDGNMIVHRLANGVITDSIDYLEAMCDLGMKEMFDVPNRLGFYPIHIAIQNSDMGLASFVVNNTTNINVKTLAGDKHTPCTLLAEAYDLPALENLIGLGCDIFIANGAGKHCEQYIGDQSTPEEARQWAAMVTAAALIKEHNIKPAVPGASKKRSARAM